MNNLKVDQTAIPVGKNYVLISNINIPKDYLEPDLIQDIIDRVDYFIKRDYLDSRNSIYFEITATYRLRHATAGTTKMWVGSFSPKFGPSILENTVFDNTFKTIVARLLTLENVVASLMSARHLESDWVFDELFSVIIHVSSIVFKEYPVLYQRNLFHGKRRSRKVATLQLPRRN